MSLKICPRCKSALSRTHSQEIICKLCGYISKIQKVVDEEQNFHGKINVHNKIYTLKAQKGPVLPALIRLETYLLHFQRLLMGSMLKVASNLPDSTSCLNSLKRVWLAYMRKMEQKRIPVAGMFRKLLVSKLEASKEHENEDPDEDPDEDQDGCGVTASFDCGEFKKYYRKQVSPLSLSPQSQAAAVFTRYLLSRDCSISEQNLLVVSEKYVRLLLSMRLGRRMVYIRDRDLGELLRSRQESRFETKSISLVYLLLHDMLKCWYSSQFQQHTQMEFESLLSIYYNRIPAMHPIIRNCIDYLSQQNSATQPDPIEPTYSLIYSLIYVSLIQLKHTLSLHQIMTHVGRLQLDSIELLYEGGTHTLEAPLNQEVITVKKIRSQAQQITHFLQYSYEFAPDNWAQKYCSLLNLDMFLSPISALHELLISRVLPLAPCKKSYALEQDIAVLAAIVVYCKLAASFDPYPYIISYDGLLFQHGILSSLLTRKYLQSRDRTKMYIPEPYQQIPSLIALYERTEKLKQRRSEELGGTGIQLREYSHLCGLSAQAIIKAFRRLTSPVRAVNLKYHRQAATPLDSKRNPKEVKQQGALTDMNPDVLRQISFNVDLDDVIVGENEFYECPRAELGIDKPAKNYEIFATHTPDVLQIANRETLLSFQESICAGICEYGELVLWIQRFEKILAQYE